MRWHLRSSGSGRDEASPVALEPRRPNCGSRAQRTSAAQHDQLHHPPRRHAPQAAARRFPNGHGGQPRGCPCDPGLLLFSTAYPKIRRETWTLHGSRPFWRPLADTSNSQSRSLGGISEDDMGRVGSVLTCWRCTRCLAACGRCWWLMSQRGLRFKIYLLP